jgi:hypothetical protein
VKFLVDNQLPPAFSQLRDAAIEFHFRHAVPLKNGTLAGKDAGKNSTKLPRGLNADC